MAYCKFCGKFIGEGENCDCEASKGAAEVKEAAENVQEKAENAAETVKEKAEGAAEAVKEKVEDTAENVKEEAAEAVKDVKEKVSEKVSEARSDAAEAIDNIKEKAEKAAKKVDGAAGEVAENLPGNMKNKKGAVYAAAAAVIILLILLLSMMGGGATSAVKKYVKAASDKHGGKTVYSLTLPKNAIKELKSDDKFKDLVDEYNEMVEDMIDDLDGKESMPKFDKITRKEKLKKSELKSAEKYFERLCDKYDADEDGIKAVKGYEMKVKTRYKDEDGDTEHKKSVICVVKLKGDGWKVITSSADGLSYYGK